MNFNEYSWNITRNSGRENSTEMQGIRMKSEHCTEEVSRILWHKINYVSQISIWLDSTFEMWVFTEGCIKIK